LEVGEKDSQLGLAALATVTDYVRQSLADNSRRAYAADLAHFMAWGGSVPASSQQIAAYIAAHACTLSVATLARRLTTLAKLHRGENLPDPTASELVRATFVAFAAATAPPLGRQRR
jgi:hypothetical protein